MHPLAARADEVQRIVAKYPGKVPVVLERALGCTLPVRLPSCPVASCAASEGWDALISSCRAPLSSLWGCVGLNVFEFVGMHKLT